MTGCSHEVTNFPFYRSHWFVECVLYGMWMLSPSLLFLAWLFTSVPDDPTLFPDGFMIAASLTALVQSSWFFVEMLFHDRERVPGYERPKWYWRALGDDQIRYLNGG